MNLFRRAPACRYAGALAMALMLAACDGAPPVALAAAGAAPPAPAVVAPPPGTMTPPLRPARSVPEPESRGPSDPPAGHGAPAGHGEASEVTQGVSASGVAPGAPAASAGTRGRVRTDASPPAPVR